LVFGRGSCRGRRKTADPGLSMRVSEKGTLARKGLACVADESSATLPNLVARGHGGKDRTEYRIEGTQDTGKMEREGYRSAAHKRVTYRTAE